MIKNICDESSVSIKQAALQYPLTHPAIDMCCVGSDDIHQLMENVEYIQAPFLGIDFYEQVLTIDIEKEYTPVAQLCFNLPFYDCDEENLKEAVL